VQKSPHIAIITGEASGDLHGSLLAGHMRERFPDIDLWGAGGRRMREAGVDVFWQSTRSGSIGLAQALMQIPGLLIQLANVKRELLARKPDVLTLIDFGAFNTRVAKFARSQGIKTVYYFPPGAWRRRVTKSRYAYLADKFITPFEWSYQALKNAGADVTLVGHPLLDVVRPELSVEQFNERLGLAPGRPVVAILPGSRKTEIQHIWPAMLGAAQSIERTVPGLQYVVAASGETQAGLIERSLGRMSSGSGRPDMRVARQMTYDVLAHSLMAITASGTATLEAAILNTPMIIAYRGSRLSHLEYLIRKSILEDHVGLPNIIAGKRICPELLSKEASPERIAELAIQLLQDPSRIAEMKRDLAMAVSSLGETGGARMAADVILELAGRASTS
jgi:lipid-A-disaccharide synthase